MGKPKSRSADLKRTLATSDVLLLRMCEVVCGGNEARFVQALSALRASMRDERHIEESCASLPAILSVIDDYRGPRSPALIAFISDLIGAQRFLASFLSANGVDFLCRWLEMKDGDIALAIFGLLEAHTDVELCTVPVIRSVLLFYDFSDIKVRGQALSVLLGVAARQRHFLCSLPTFVAHLLDFAMLLLPDQLWASLLETAADLLSGMDTLPPMVTKRLGRLPAQVPPAMTRQMFACVDRAMNFQAFREHFPDSMWEACVTNLEFSRAIFELFVTKPPEDPTVMIQTLLSSARVDGNCLTLLTRFAKFPICAQMIALKLPLGIHRHDDLLFRLYIALLGQQSLRAAVYQQPEFYQVCIKRNDGQLDTEICQPLKADEVRPELARAVGFVRAICGAICSDTDLGMLWDVLGIVYKWTAPATIPEFEGLIPRFTELLGASGPAASLGAFLCLLNFAHHCPGKIDIPRLQQYAVIYLFQADNPTAQQLALTFLETTRSIAALNIQNITDVFLGRARTTPPSVSTKRAAALLSEIGAARSIAPGVISELKLIANS
jgi:hypothetical protein